MKRFSHRWTTHLFALLTVLLLTTHASRAAPAPTPQAATILVVGDSVSAEYGLARDTGWVQLLRQRLAAQHENYTVVNASISGDTTSNGLARLPDLLARTKPQIVIIELGGNDGLRGQPIAAAHDNLAHMIELAKAAHAKVVLTGIQLPPNYGPSYTRDFANMYPELAKSEHVALVPFLFQGFAEQRDLFQADHIHPSSAAQPMMLDNVWGPLKPLLNAPLS